jgi:CubicO group peptidase (beta-lactamase class C family)
MSMPVTFDFPRCTPEEQGISSAIIADFVATIDHSIHSLHSFMLLRRGNLVAEGWWQPWRPRTPHMLFSLSKSFTSTAVGLAIDEGRLTVEEPVFSFFPADAPKKVSANLAAMKVHHLLSMSTGHDLDTTERVFRQRNPFKAFLGLQVEHTPGTHFVYNSAASYMLAAIVQKLSGKTLLEYLTPRLFEPLGITGATWETHPNGVNFGGWGLKIKTEDIARFGQLYLQKGVWNGQQILPEAWVKIATAKQVSNGNDPNSDWAQGYGYQFWRCRHNIYRGDGAFGQFCIVMPEQEAVLAMTAGVSDMQPVLNVVWEKLLPGMEKEKLPNDEARNKTLSNTCEYLTIDPPQGSATTTIAKNISGRSYLFEPNAERLKSLHFDFGQDECTVTYRLLGGGKRGGIHRLTAGYSTWREGIAMLGELAPQPVAASGVWTATDTFTLTLCQYETPFILTITCRFDGNKLLYEMRPNVAFGAPELLQFVGIAE